MSGKRITSAGIVESSFELLRAKDGAGATWSEREELFNRLWSITPMSYRAAEAILDVVDGVSRSLIPGQAISASGFRYTLEEAKNGYHLVRIEDLRGSGVWSVARSSHMGSQHFAVRKRHGDDATILVSGSLAVAQPDMPLRIMSANHSPDSFLDLSKLATLLAAGKLRGERKVFDSDPIAPVLTLDGGVPGESARRLHRMLYEDVARRAMAWAVPLFEQVAKAFAQEGFWWGCNAAHWSFRDDDRFPRFSDPTTKGCLLAHPDGKSVAMLFRDAQPNLETETYIAWREGRGSRKLHLLPIEEGSMDDIEEFLRSGGVPALTFDPDTGDVHVKEKAMASGVLRTFCDHVGEAWTVMATLPLYASNGERPMATEDFSDFGKVAPWTARGRRMAAEAVEAYAREAKKSPAP